MSAITHKALFEKMRDTNVVARCTDYAHWTLPQLMADFDSTRGQSRHVIERDYQEVGAMLVNHLSSKLAKLLFPVSTPFFRVKPSAELLAKASEQGKLAALASQLAKLELDASQRLFLNASYAQLIIALKHLIITGNVLMYRDSKTSSSRTYGLQSFTIRRDGAGKMMDCVLREFTTVEGLPYEVQEALRRTDRSKYSRPERNVELYTRIHREAMPGGNARYTVSEQVDTVPIGVESSYPEHLCPWHAPTWSLILGEHYGRGLVEDFAGGFAKLSDLSEAATLYGIEMMRVVHLVAAGSGTDIDDLARAEQGQYIRGDQQSVAAHESGDAAKLREVRAEIEAVFSRLARAFMYQANTRDAERVTAYELQRDAQEAEFALGGAYSALADGIQIPLAAVLITEESPEALEGLVTGDLRTHIMAGIPALGRSSDVQNLLLAVQEAGTIVPALAQLDQRFDPQKLVDLIMSGRSVDVKALHRTEQQMQELAAAQQQAAQGQQQIAEAQATADQMQQLSDLAQSGQV